MWAPLCIDACLENVCSVCGNRLRLPREGSAGKEHEAFLDCVQSVQSVCADDEFAKRGSLHLSG